MPKNANAPQLVQTWADPKNKKRSASYVKSNSAYLRSAKNVTTLPRPAQNLIGDAEASWSAHDSDPWLGDGRQSQLNVKSVREYKWGDPKKRLVRRLWTDLTDREDKVEWFLGEHKAGNEYIYTQIVGVS